MVNWEIVFIAVKNCLDRALQFSLMDYGVSCYALLHDGGSRVEEYNKNNKDVAKDGAIAELNHSVVDSPNKGATLQVVLPPIKLGGFGRGSLHKGKYRNIGSLISISSRSRIVPLANTHFFLQMDYLWWTLPRSPSKISLGIPLSMSSQH